MLEIESYDVGQKRHPRFPDQRKMAVAKPLLSEMVTTIESYVKRKGLKQINYNIEIKRVPTHDGVFHPEMKLFADLCIMTIKDLGILSRTTVQCFDIETLQYIHQRYPEVRLVYLIQNTESFKVNIANLGFEPYVYSPYFKLVDTKLVDYCNKQNIKLVPWTVNSNEEIQNMIDLKVDGIISDYPDRVIKLVNQTSK